MKKVSLASVVRRALMTFDFPEHVPAGDVAAKARIMWHDAGGVQRVIDSADVARTRHILRTLLGRPLTKEKVADYDAECNSEKPHRRGQWKGVKPHVNLTSIIRQQLLTLEDPETVDRQRLTVTVRARYVQMGGNSNDVTNDAVSDTLTKLRYKLGAPLTKEKLLASEKNARNTQGGRTIPTMRQAARIVEKTVLQTPQAHDPTATAVSLLVTVKAFIDGCGGSVNARKLLDAVEGLTK